MTTDTTPPAESKLVQDELVTTEHELVIGGETVRYRATSGLVSLDREASEDDVYQGARTVARMFVTAYTRTDVGDAAQRPITFAYNGGPGSSSVWLHLGTFGPRRVVMGEEGEPLPAPYRLADNEHSLLDVTDLVFIDPVGTGWSRPAEGQKAKDFHGYQQDLESVGDLIREWLGRENRWLSPKFLAGESYGTTRSAGLSGYLQNRHGIYLTGIMLISSVLDFSTVRFHVGNDLPPLLYLPSYAATAWYHQRLAPELQAKPLAELLAEVEGFTVERYSLALLKGARLGADERAAIARQVAAYTGTTPDFVERNNTCAWPCRASPRSCCAASARPWGASTAATRAATATPVASSSSTTPATRPSRSRTPPPGTPTCAPSSASSPPPTSPTRSSPASTRTGTTRSSPASTSTSPTRCATP